MSAQTSPYAGVGITLSYKFGTATAFSLLALLMDDCEFSGFENTVIGIKPLNAQTVTKVAGRTDSGTFTGSCYLVNSDAGVAQLLALATAKTLGNWQLMLPDGTPPVGDASPTGTTYNFMGFVASAKPGNFTGEDAPTLDFEIAISGLVTVGAGT